MLLSFPWLRIPRNFKIKEKKKTRKQPGNRTQEIDTNHCHGNSIESTTLRQKSTHQKSKVGINWSNTSRKSNWSYGQLLKSSIYLTQYNNYIQIWLYFWHDSTVIASSAAVYPCQWNSKGEAPHTAWFSWFSANRALLPLPVSMASQRRRLTKLDTSFFIGHYGYSYELKNWFTSRLVVAGAIVGIVVVFNYAFVQRW